MPGTHAASRTSPSECPVCGANLPPRALACPDCGADKNTGWDEDSTRYDGLDLPDTAFADDDNESPYRRTRLVRKPHPAWVLIALGLAALFTVFALFGH